jgi:hypothetical protein
MTDEFIPSSGTNIHALAKNINDNKSKTKARKKRVEREV